MMRNKTHCDAENGKTSGWAILKFQVMLPATLPASHLEYRETRENSGTFRWNYAENRLFTNLTNFRQSENHFRLLDFALY